MANDIDTALVWFRRDLRLRDHPALWNAAREASTLIPVYIERPPRREWSPGPAKTWWLRRSIRDLRERFETCGLTLILRRGEVADELPRIAEQTDADALYFNDNVAPVDIDETATDACEEHGLSVRRFRARILHDPDEVETTSGGPYHVFTPFWRRFRDVVEIDTPLDEPDLDPGLAPPEWPPSSPASDLWNEEGAPPKLADAWTPGADAARERLDQFVATSLTNYETERERPDRDGTSRLSPRLHYGELSPRQVWKAVEARDDRSGRGASAESFLREIAWREFSYHLYYHYPSTPTEPLKEKFAAFPWREHDALESRWRRGETGYPLVDAGMRQLSTIGWMHNRVRMVVASFLTKHLLVPWQRGARWFWKQLVDADLPNNTMGWQWAGGCGADAQPFFRMFNPVKQSETHDPEGEYIRRWVSELSNLDGDAIHAPWRRAQEELDDAGIVLGDDYPRPVVDHSEARQRALEAWERIK